MPAFNILQFYWGRLIAFFLLYVTEGVPLGFAATAVATQMRRQGLTTEAIGLFVASLYLPWAWKWAAGPFVDLIRFGRFGHYRPWILLTQLLMLATLGAAATVDYVSAIGLFTAVLLVHNACGATQDVAIDALACRVLREDERGIANGMMFAGAYTGQTIGGAGVLFLSGRLETLHAQYAWLPDDFRVTFAVPLLVIGGVWLFVLLFLREGAETADAAATVTSETANNNSASGDSASGDSAGGDSDGSVGSVGSGASDGSSAAGVFRAGEVPPVAPPFDPAPLPVEDAVGPAAGLMRRIVGELAGYIVTVVVSMFGTKRTLLALGFALLPAGAYALSLPLQQTLAVELGFTDADIASLSLVSGILSACGCVVGGFLSDRIGRRLCLGTFIALTALPTVWLALRMQQHNWILPIPVDAPNRPEPPDALVAALWTAVLAYSAVHGLMYGTRTALFMDVVTPSVAATQFTAYMAVLNLTISYSSAWQGWAAQRFGYPLTLGFDAAFGLVGVILLLFLTRAPERAPVA